jgi:hypothetical protein
MRSYGNGRLSATTQVKVLSPVMFLITQGQGVHFPEANIGAVANGETVSGVSGSKSVAGKRTVCAGTWESRSASRSCQGAEEVTRWYGAAAVGPIHSRGVGGAMPVGPRGFGALEGIGGLTLRAEACHAGH